MPKSRRKQVPKLRARLAESEKKAADTLAVLNDLLLEKGLPPWLCVVIDRRDELLRMLRLLVQTRRPIYGAEYSGDFPYGGAGDRCAELMRILGGPEEVARQVDEAWAVAIEEDSYRDTNATAQRQMDEARQAHAGETHSERCWASLAWGHGECVCGGQACEHLFIAPNFTVDGETGETREVTWGCTACGAPVNGPTVHTRGPALGRMLEGLASGEARFETPDEMLERAQAQCGECGERATPEDPGHSRIGDGTWRCVYCSLWGIPPGADRERRRAAARAPITSPATAPTE